MERVEAAQDDGWEKNSACGTLGPKNADHFLGREPSALGFQPGVSELTPSIAGLDRGRDSQSESLLVFLDWVFGIESMFPDEMAEVDGSEGAPAQSAGDEIDSLSRLSPFELGHCRILGKGRDPVSDSCASATGRGESYEECI